MTNDELIDLIGRMRVAQRRFDRERTTAALTEARRLQTEVDRALLVRRTSDLVREDARGPD